MKLILSSIVIKAMSMLQSVCSPNLTKSFFSKVARSSDEKFASIFRSSSTTNKLRQKWFLKKTGSASQLIIATVTCVTRQPCWKAKTTLLTTTTLFKVDMSLAFSALQLAQGFVC
ncbi:unnamed protein product [Haemonchus placei]|uniref:Secreted protein n=1 Tax=Haemonchus placei TaxID=6290 RepID=A0A0N4X4M9_HAEPC|nr:unnamed protein product [Haemonchus placei]